MAYELLYLNSFIGSTYSQSACVQPSPSDVNNSADGYRILGAQENYLKGLNWIKNGKGRKNE